MDQVALFAITIMALRESVYYYVEEFEINSYYYVQFQSI